MLLDAKSGSILAADTMPDGKESYMSPVYYEQPDGSRNIVFGTGGETISGSLYHCSLDDLKNRQLTKAQKLVSENGHGFIAPPTVVDLNGDGFLDIAAISHAATVFGIDGKTLRANWMRVIPQAECSNSIAAGQFTGDDTPELFTFVSKGLWPQNTGSVQILMDGQNGKLLYRDSIGCTGFSSPVVYDLNNDGREEVLLSINEYDCTQGLIGSEKIQVQNRLIAIDFSQPAVQTIEQLAGFKNVFSTPWIGDLDNDGYLDIIHCQYYSPGSDMVVFLGMQIKRISTTVRIRKPVRWGAYMGSKGNGVYGF